MDKLKIIVEGYAKILEKGWKASSTCTLIYSNGKKIIVDPGTNRDLLITNLKKEGLEVGDIDIVVLTHHHTDHYLNAALFTNAKVIDDEAVYQQDFAELYDGESVPETDIKIIKTPGHTLKHFSLIVETKEYGTVIVAQDVFWWQEGEEQHIDIVKHDDFAEDMEALKQSREKVLERADWIIPGHGKMFKNIYKGKSINSK